MTAWPESYARYLAAVEAALPLYLPEQADADGGLVVAAARYSLLGGGKRFRPVLLLGTVDLLGGDWQRALPAACALEMIHTYSLIHDDLPCMDDDDLRRGRPTCHRVYGEAIAVLAGDTLLNRAYEVLLDAVDPTLPGTVAAARLIAHAAGSRGMIGGQTLDLAAEGRLIDEPSLRTLHRMKTGALIKAPILAAASLAGTAPAVTGILERYAEAIGLAFQIQDDILDVTSDAAALGKTAGKDQRDRKSTYVTLLGLDAARRRLDEAIAAARGCLAELHAAGPDMTFLSGLTTYLLDRSS